MSQSDRHPQRSPLRSRLLALPFVALCAVAYLGSAAHFAFVQHATCLEHGEVIHVSESQAHAQPPRLEDSHTDVRITRAGQEEAAAHGAEAHCTHTFLRRESLVPAAWYLLASDPETESGPVLGLEPVFSEQVARLRLAPKSSPPLS